MVLTIEQWRVNGVVKKSISGLDEEQIKKKYESYVKRKNKIAGGEKVTTMASSETDNAGSSVDPESISKLYYESFMRRLSGFNEDVKTAVIEKITDGDYNTGLTGDKLALFKQVYDTYSGYGADTKLKIRDNIKEMYKSSRVVKKQKPVEKPKMAEEEEEEPEKETLMSWLTLIRSKTDNKDLIDEIDTILSVDPVKFDFVYNNRKRAIIKLINTAEKDNQKIKKIISRTRKSGNPEIYKISNDIVNYDPEEDEGSKFENPTAVVPPQVQEETKTSEPGTAVVHRDFRTFIAEVRDATQTQELKDVCEEVLKLSDDDLTKFMNSTFNFEDNTTITSLYKAIAVDAKNNTDVNGVVNGISDFGANGELSDTYHSIVSHMDIVDKGDSSALKTATKFKEDIPITATKVEDASQTSPSEQQVGTNITGETPGTRLVQSDAFSTTSSGEVLREGMAIFDTSSLSSSGGGGLGVGDSATGSEYSPIPDGLSVTDTTAPVGNPQDPQAPQIPFATTQVKNVDIIHKVSILLFFGSIDKPNWDLTLQALIQDNEEIIKPMINSLIDSIIAANGSKILVSTREKDSDIDEFNEIIQLHFCLERNMHTGTRTASVTIPLKNLLGGTTLGATQEPVSGPSDAGPFTPGSTVDTPAPEVPPAQPQQPDQNQNQIPEDEKPLIMNQTRDAYGKPIFPITKMIIKKKTKEINVIPGLPILENLVLYNKIPAKKSIKYIDC